MPKIYRDNQCVTYPLGKQVVDNKNIYRTKRKVRGRETVIKTYGAKTKDNNPLARAKRERETLGRLAGVEGVLDVLGEGTEPEPFLVLERRIEDLDDTLELNDNGKYTIVLPPDRQVALLYALAGIYTDIHTCEIIHTDLKHGNTLVSRRARATLFGRKKLSPSKRGAELKKLLRVTDFEGSISFSDDVTEKSFEYTVGYGAPELWAPHDQLSDRTDVYALAIVANGVIAREHPFHEKGFGEMDEKTEKLVMKLMTKEEPRELPLAFSLKFPAATNLLKRSLRKKQGERPPMKELAGVFWEALCDLEHGRI